MFITPIITEELSLDNFLEHLKFDLLLTTPQKSHMKNIMNAMNMIGFWGK